MVAIPIGMTSTRFDQNQKDARSRSGCSATRHDNYETVSNSVMMHGRGMTEYKIIKLGMHGKPKQHAALLGGMTSMKPLIG